MRLARPSVRHVRAPKWKTKSRIKTKIAVKVPQGRSNGCANFQLERSTRLGGWPRNLSTLDSQFSIYIQAYLL